MEDLILVYQDKCVGCNICIRVCPTTDANKTTLLEDGRFVTTVNNSKCINCGECVKACQHGARDYIDDTDEFFEELEKKSVIVLVSPSIKTAFPNTWKSILKWLRTSGASIYDASYGADICTWAYMKAIENKKMENVITQPCPAIVNYIEKYQPQLIGNLSPVHSPVACQAVYLTRYLKMNTPIAVLSPCIAKKSEFDSLELIKYNVTYKKMKEYFKRNRIKLDEHDSNDFEFDYDGQQGMMGAIYPRPGGLRDNVWLHNPDINITTSVGANKVYSEIDMYLKMPEFKHPEIFDVLSCEYGCNGGAGAGNTQNVFDIMSTMREIEKASLKKRKTGVFNATSDKQFKFFDENLNLYHFLRKYNPSPVSVEIDEQQLNAAFERIGKFTDADKKINCGACGYKTCKNMAAAICKGLNVPENCIVYAKKLLMDKNITCDNQNENKQIISVIEKSKEFSNELVQKVELITDSLRIINNSNIKIGEKSTIVSTLLSKIIQFCSQYDTLDAEPLAQLINILERTSAAFKALDDNVTETAQNTECISSSAEEVTRIIDKVNAMLNETIEAVSKNEAIGCI